MSDTLINQNYDIVYEDVDDIYLYRKNDFDQPGLCLVYNPENNKKQIVELGFFPHKQFMKITL